MFNGNHTQKFAIKRKRGGDLNTFAISCVYFLFTFRKASCVCKFKTPLVCDGNGSIGQIGLTSPAVCNDCCTQLTTVLSSFQQMTHCRQSVSSSGRVRRECPTEEMHQPYCHFLWRLTFAHEHHPNTAHILTQFRRRYQIVTSRVQLFKFESVSKIAIKSNWRESQ